MSKQRLLQLQQKMTQCEQDESQIKSTNAELITERQNLKNQYDNWYQKNSTQTNLTISQQNKLMTINYDINNIKNMCNSEEPVKTLISSILDGYTEYQEIQPVEVMGSLLEESNQLQDAINNSLNQEI